jgi:site-specific DNA-methyltransferase (adenine-specific)
MLYTADWQRDGARPQNANDNASKYAMCSSHLHSGDCLHVLKTIPDSSVHLCVTDPPYFLHHLGDEWTAERAMKGKDERKMCGNLRGGMKFDPKQGQRFQSFMTDVSTEIYRVLVPGAFFISFSQARLYHRLAIAIENVGFELRDMLAWKYTGQPKAMSMNHFIERRDISPAEKARMFEAIGGRKSAMLKPQIEPMTLAQKPCDGTLVDNWMTHGTGLADVTQSLDGLFPGSVMEMRKPTKADKGVDNDHPTVKPVPLIEHLIRLFSVEGQIVLDPFLGSGSHGVAAANAGRSFIGIERDPHYLEIAKARISGDEAQAA